MRGNPEAMDHGLPGFPFFGQKLDRKLEAAGRVRVAGSGRAGSPVRMVDGAMCAPGRPSR